MVSTMLMVALGALGMTEQLNEFRKKEMEEDNALQARRIQEQTRTMQEPSLSSRPRRRLNAIVDLFEPKLLWFLNDILGFNFETADDDDDDKEHDNPSGHATPSTPSVVITNTIENTATSTATATSASAPAEATSSPPPPAPSSVPPIPIISVPPSPSPSPSPSHSPPSHSPSSSPPKCSTKIAYEPLKDFGEFHSSDAHISEQFDFIVAGGGTGGLIAGSRLAEAGEKVLVIEAGKMVAPVNQKLAYNLCKKDEGVLAWCHTFHKLVPLNWVAAVVTYQEFFIKKIKGVPVKIPLLSSPFFLKDEEANSGLNKFNNLQQLLDDFEEDPVKWGQLKNHEMVTKTLYKLNPDISKTNVTFEFEGPLMALWFDVLGEIFFSFISPNFGSDGIEYFRHYYPGSANPIFYPRGKNMGGSSLINNAVTYGLTDEWLARAAEEMADPEWASEHIAKIVFEDNSMYSHLCDFSAMKEKIDKGTYDFTKGDGTVIRDGDTPWKGARYGCTGNSAVMIQSEITDLFPRSKQAIGDYYDCSYDDIQCFHPDAFISSRSEREREVARVTTHSFNPFSVQHSNGADHINNVIALGNRLTRLGKNEKNVGVCYYPTHAKTLSESKMKYELFPEEVLADEDNCERAEGAKKSMHIRTSAQVANLMYDEADPLRVVGVEWYREYDQLRPQQNRRDINVDATCTVEGSTFGVGLDNTRDCTNDQFTWMDYEGQEDDMVAAIKASTAKNDQYIVKNGYESTPHLFQQTMLPPPYEQLPAMRKVKKSYCKKEVLIAAGTPASSGLLFRSGIGEKEHLESKEVKVRADLPAGYIHDNWEINVEFGPKDPLRAAYFFYNTDVWAANPVRLDPEHSYITESIDKYWKSCGAEATELRTQGTLGPSYDGKGLKHPCLRTLGNQERYSGAWNVDVRTSIKKCMDGDQKTVYDCNLHFLAPNGWPTGWAIHAYDLRANGLHDWSPGYIIGSVTDEPLYGTFIGEKTGKEPLPKGLSFTHLSIPVVLSSTSGPITQAGKINCPSGDHPLGRVDVHYTDIKGWMPELRKRVLAQATNKLFATITKAFEEEVPTGYEYFSATKRKKSLTDYALPAAVTGLKQTNFMVVLADSLRQYVNDTANPIEYGFEKSFDMGAGEFFEEVWKKMGWGHQTMGGAKGGTPQDKWSVTDSHGRVYNIKGARVVDASFAPTVPMGNPWLSVSQWAAVLGYFANKDWNTGYENMNIMPLEEDHPYYVDKPALNAAKLSQLYDTYPTYG